MKSTILIQAAITVAVAGGLTGREREAKLPPLPVGAVVFEGSGVALVPGEDWKQVRNGPFTREPDVCLPVLESDDRFNGAVIQVYSSSSGRSAPETRAASIQRSVAGQPDVIKDSIRRGDFVTANGQKGVHVSYDLKVEQNGRTGTGRTHLYIVKNRKGSVVGVAYTTVAGKDSEEVHRMIRRTPRLQ